MFFAKETNSRYFWLLKQRLFEEEGSKFSESCLRLSKFFEICEKQGKCAQASRSSTKFLRKKSKKCGGVLRFALVLSLAQPVNHASVCKEKNEGITTSLLPKNTPDHLEVTNMF